MPGTVMVDIRNYALTKDAFNMITSSRQNRWVRRCAFETSLSAGVCGQSCHLRLSPLRSLQLLPRGGFSAVFVPRPLSHSASHQGKKVKIKVLVIAASIFLGMSHVALGATSLCARNEKVYFSCATKSGKIISLCGKVFEKDKFGSRVDFDNQWLQYRFGSPTTVELAFPRKKENSVSSFKAEKIRAQGGQVHLDAVVFVSGGIAYSVESVAPDTGEILEGVSVEDPKSFSIENHGKRRKQYPKARILCAERANTENFFDLVEYLAE